MNLRNFMPEQKNFTSYMGRAMVCFVIALAEDSKGGELAAECLVLLAVALFFEQHKGSVVITAVGGQDNVDENDLPAPTPENVASILHATGLPFEKKKIIRVKVMLDAAAEVIKHHFIIKPQKSAIN